MQIGFTVEAAVPKRLRAVEEPPVQQPMRGDRKITQAPSTDQKKVRRAMQRKTASAGDVHEHDNVQAKDEFDAEHIEPGGGHHHKHRAEGVLNDTSDCRICGGNLKPVGSSSTTATTTARCEDCDTEHQLQSASALNDTADCRLCGGDLVRQPSAGDTTQARCKDCGTEHSLQEAGQRTASWQPQYDISRYMPTGQKSAIARRAQSVLDAPEEIQ